MEIWYSSYYHLPQGFSEHVYVKFTNKIDLICFNRSQIIPYSQKFRHRKSQFFFLPNLRIELLNNPQRPNSGQFESKSRISNIHRVQQNFHSNHPMILLLGIILLLHLLKSLNYLKMLRHISGQNRRNHDFPQINLIRSR